MKKLSLFSGLIGSVLVCGCAGSGSSETDSGSTAAASTGPSATSTSGGTQPTEAMGTTEEATSSTTAAMTTTTADPTTGDIGDAECSIWEQDCPENFKCMAFAEAGSNFFTGTKCTPVVKDGGVAGDTCYGEGGWSTGVDDCALGFACWNQDPDTYIGACVEQCVGTMDAPTCNNQADVCVAWTPGFAHICLQVCDPLLQDCQAGQSCLPDYQSNAANFVCVIDYSFNEGQAFDQCMSDNVCDPGLLCVPGSEAIECTGSPYCCVPWCDLSDPNSKCPAQNSECESFYPPGLEVPDAYKDVGFCGLP